MGHTLCEIRLISCVKPDGYSGVVISQAGKAVPKRKQWNPEQVKGSKRSKAEVKSTQTETENLPDGLSTEAYELLVKGRLSF